MSSIYFDRALTPLDRWGRSLAVLSWAAMKPVLATLLAGGIVLPCGFLFLTGVVCPLCGGTHAAQALLGGDFHAAWEHNAGAIALIVAAALQTLLWLCEAVAGKSLCVHCALPGGRIVRLSTLIWGAAMALLLLSWPLRLLTH